jgi:hypothetical protein
MLIVAVAIVVVIDVVRDWKLLEEVSSFQKTRED